MWTPISAMCDHDWCGVRIGKEIQEFESGLDEDYSWDKPKLTEALTEEQKAILEQRGFSNTESIDRLQGQAFEYRWCGLS